MMEVLILAGLILLNGLFALGEIAIVAARPARLQERAEHNELGALAALALKENPNRFFSTTQIGITLIGTLAGAFGGASVAESLTGVLQRYALLAPYAQGLGVGVVVVLITYFSLVFGELTPKRLALANPETLAIRLAPFFSRLSRLAAPLVTLLTWSTQAVLQIFGVQPALEPPVTDDEIRLLMIQGAQAGIFEPLESEMVHGVLRMGDQRARTVMTPRHEIVWLDLQNPLEESLEKIRTSGYSRFPVCNEQLDNVLGMAYAKDLLARQLACEPLDLTAHLREPLFVPEGMPALEMLERFRTSRTHVALVTDEYGGVEGLITLHDLIENIAGDIRSAGATEGPSAVLRADGSWLLDGDYPVDELQALLGIPELPGREQAGYETVAGLVLTLLDHIPHRGERVVWQAWTFEVLDMDGLRVDQILASLSPQST